MAGLKTVKKLLQKRRVTKKILDSSRYDASLEGSTCSGCSGTGSMFEQEDAHRSAGTIPCKRGYFRGHGTPTCRNGKLRFSDYDKENWPRNKKRVAT